MIQKLSPEKGAAAVNAADAQGLHAARQRIVELIERRSQADGAGGASECASPAPAPGDSLKAGLQTFVYWERHVASRMGLSIDVVRRLRGRLEEGRDWVKRGKGRIVYSEEGAARLRMVAEVPAQAGPIKAAPGEVQEAPRVVLQVYKRCPNVHVVLCHAPGSDPGDVGNLVRLWVKDGRKFRPGQEVTGRHLQEDLFEHVPAGRNGI